MKNWFKELIRLPTPQELGWSKSGGLESRKFSRNPKGKTWDDWEEYCKKNHPVKYFISEVLLDYLSMPAGYWKKFSYWAKCKFLVSHRYHLLDLRKVDVLSDYDYGYIDPSEIMRLSAWAALERYIKEKPTDYYSDLSPEEKKDVMFIEQKARYDELQSLYRWWTVERIEEEAQEKRLFEAHKLNTRRDYSEYSEKEWSDTSTPWLTFIRWRGEQDEEMFLRLVKLRPYL